MFITQLLNAQQADTVVTNSVFTSYYSFVTHNPIIVTYTFNYIDGNCDRSKFDFKSSKEFCDSSYYKSGFDRGHLCNVEDFSTDCEKAKLTFSYYNCAPQTSYCNRSSWKKLENQTRLLATGKDVLVINGVLCASKYKIGCMWTPTHFYKIVIDRKTNNIIMCSYVVNDLTSAPYSIKINDLMKMLDKPHWILLNSMLTNVNR